MQRALKSNGSNMTRVYNQTSGVIRDVKVFDERRQSGRLLALLRGRLLALLRGRSLALLRGRLLALLRGRSLALLRGRLLALLRGRLLVLLRGRLLALLRARLLALLRGRLLALLRGAYRIKTFRINMKIRESKTDVSSPFLCKNLFFSVVTA